MEDVFIKVTGVPVGKGRPRFAKKGFSPVKVYTPEKTSTYEELVRLSYMEQAGNIRFEKDIPLKVDIKAFSRYRKAFQRKRRSLSVPELSGTLTGPMPTT